MASSLSVTSVPSRRARPSIQSVLVVAAAVGSALLTAAASALAAADPHTLRLIAALAIGVALLGVALWRPRIGIQVTFVFLVVMATLRRVLILPAGWTSLDPLLLVGPMVVGLLAVRLFVVGRRPLAPDRISRLVLIVLVLAVLEVPNPAGGGVFAGIGGLLLLGVPLLWFFVGREYASDRLTRNLLILTIALSLGDAAYGLAQTQIGFPSWDLAWFDVNGYSSLNIGNSIRAFGTFSSAQEYALFLGAGLAVAAAFVAQRRYVAVLPIPLLAVALFFASGRAALITAFLAIVIVGAIAPRRARLAGVIAVVAVLAAYGGLRAVGSGGSGNPLISHQVGGLTNPLNPSQSTLLIHLTLVSEGIRQGVTRPLGEGTGATNQGGSKLGGQGGQQATEVDFSNAFVGLGLIGGIAFLSLVISVLVRAFRAWFAGNALMLPVIALLVVCVGQWWEGGLYALNPLIWLIIGWVARVTAPGSAIPIVQPLAP